MRKITETITMKILIVNILIIAAILPAYPKETKQSFDLEEAMKPLFVATNDQYCFIAELFSVFQYSVKDFKFIKKFGGRGEGPGQFPVILGVHTTPQHLIISSLSRVYVYSKDGEYLYERKTNIWSTHFDLANEKFLCKGSIEENQVKFNTIDILDNNFKKEKELYRKKSTPVFSGKVNPLNRETYYAFINNKILIANNDSTIAIFNHQGEKEKDIRLNLEKKPITDEFKKTYIENFQKNPRRRMVYGMIKDRIDMGEYFPDIKFVQVNGNLIYIITYLQQDEKNLCLILNADGQELKRVWIPVPDFESYFHPFSFSNGSYYYLLDDLKKEKWVITREQLLTEDESN